MNRRQWGWLLAAAMLWPQVAGAGLYEKGGANGLGARAMGLAGAYTAVADDETAVVWNPAGLGELSTWHFGTSLGSLYDGRMRLANFSAAGPLQQGAAAGFSWQHEYYTQSAEINADALYLAASLPFAPDPNLRLGAALKLLFGSVPKAELNYTGVGVDFGLRYLLPLPAPDQQLTLSLMLSDLDTRLAWSHGASDPVPQSVVLGSAWQPDRSTTAAVDLEWIRSGTGGAQETSILRLGLERWFEQIVGVRAGYMLNSSYASTFSVGAGVKIAEWDIQYALVGQIADLGWSHRLTASFGLPKSVQALPTPAATPAATPVAVPTELRLSLLALPEVFSPRGGALADSVVFKLQVLEGDVSPIRQWRLTVSDPAGITAREWTGQEYTMQFPWDGTGATGAASPDGVYQARLELFDAQGSLLGRAAATVQLKSTLPGVALQVAPKRLLTFADRKPLPMSFKPRQTENLPPVRWTLSVRSPEGKELQTYTGEGKVPKEQPWTPLVDGQPLPPGRYAVELAVTDEQGQSQSAGQTFTVVLVEPQIQMDAAPRLVDLNAAAGAAVTFTLGVIPKEEVTAWKLEVRDAQTKTLVRRMSGAGSPPNRVVWNCRDQAGQMIKLGAYYKTQVTVTFAGAYSFTGPMLALGTDLGVEETARALALHLTLVTFSPGSTTIQVGDFRRLQQAAETINKYATKYRLQIKGYTDTQEAKGQELELAWERARKVKEYLNYSCKIPADRMEIVGYGARLPLAPETTPAGRAKNRRAEIVLIIQK
jgi:outer membrane protein OmpA-like peptidoglycan-associated protein